MHLRTPPVRDVCSFACATTALCLIQQVGVDMRVSRLAVVRIDAMRQRFVAKAPVYVQLTKPVESLGERGDIVAVDSTYFPGKKLYTYQQIAEQKMSPVERASKDGGVLQKAVERSNRSKDILEKLAALSSSTPSLIFHRVPRAKDSDSFFGSVSVSDVIELLRSKHDVVLSAEEHGVRFLGSSEAEGVVDRVRQYGTHRLSVTIHGEDVTLDVVVAPTEAT
ncbi:hypothetical protein M427DRAFT_35601 [Gonapodya prolifera JEL478]|uniref:Ribosomal protein L9 domain-containing protein n=1 Tax=Gonapodya prolifera (strain JEL478) TaxID=1344416 RepID=A0A139A4Q7_GONPJ|nr:hypothetical protein M427DRAFT_35601 [Gonapodya prolifera JEL478]|eukprot:KXS11629.1 hypothetical protein M427DRAFT_35601 [Gonapodya prolifera JEL478]